MKVLITGASGFLGGHLVDGALRAGQQVRALVRPTSDVRRLATLPHVELAYGDLRDIGSLRRAVAGIDVVHHSAGRVVDRGSRETFMAENVEGTALLLAAARDAGVSRFVFISSPSALMGPGDPDRLGIDESIPYPERWLNFYSETKAAAERLVLAANRPDFTTVALRPRGVWGPRDHCGFLPRLVTRMAGAGLPNLSAGKPVMVSLCHCDNAVAAALRAAQAPADLVGGRPYFIADLETTDLWAFLARVADLFGVRPPGRHLPTAARDFLVEAIELLWLVPELAARRERPLSRYSVALLTKSSTYNTTAAAQDLGYQPVTDQQDGLRQLLAWVESIGGTHEFVRLARSHT